METVTPRMILGMNAVEIAASAAAFHQAGHYEKTNDRYVLLNIADSLADMLRRSVGTDDGNRLIIEQMELLKGCIEAALDPDQLGREVDAFLKTL
jgi:hypothetical protein